jgi:hypothetical protein
MYTFLAALTLLLLLLLLRPSSLLSLCLVLPKK